MSDRRDGDIVCDVCFIASYDLFGSRNWIRVRNRENRYSWYLDVCPRCMRLSSKRCKDIFSLENEK